MYSIAEELRSRFGNRTVWVSKLTPNETMIFLNKRFPKLQNEQQLVEAIACISNGDLRQAQIQVEFQSGQKDRPSHTYFDAQDALCNGTGESRDYSAAVWVQENHTQDEKSIEEHALLASNFASFDALENSIPFPDATEDTTSKSKDSQSSDNTSKRL